MILFSLLALLMALIAIAAVAVPLWRHRERGRSDTAATLAVYRERDAELAREHAQGNLGDDELAEAREELERELLAATAPPASAGRGPSARPVATLAAAVIAVPAVALAVYALTGRPGLVTQDAASGLSPARLERLRSMDAPQRIAELEPLVEQRPGATRAWVLLARAYRTVGRHGDAVNAYARVRAQGEANPWILARQAEALLLANGRRFTASVEDLVDRALQMDEANPLALMLAGHAALARGANDEAVRHWQRLAEDMPADSDNRALLDRLIARARGESDAADGGRAAAAADGADADAAPATDDGATLTVRVTLDASLADAAPADTPVFVFARAAGAGADSPPLAVQRLTVAALPAEVTLSDAQAMMAERTLSQAERVRVTARASLQGGAMASSGDLEGSSEPVAIEPGASTAVAIDRRLP